MTTHTSGNSSIDTSLIRDIYCGPEVLFETCVAMKFVDDDDDDEYTRKSYNNFHLCYFIFNVSNKRFCIYVTFLCVYQQLSTEGQRHYVLWLSERKRMHAFMHL